jgi:DNA-binding CsgD family transcriptional regulator
MNPSFNANYNAASAANEAWQASFAMALDEVDYGVILLDARWNVLHTNFRARSELDASHPLSIESGRLHAKDTRDQETLWSALHAAHHRGLRRLMWVGQSAGRVSVAIVPLATTHSSMATMVTLGKRRLCETLSVQSFAQSHGLTVAEGRVLAGLCEGVTPNDLARRHGVALSTVRTQISCIRGKTGSMSIDDLVRVVAKLPPLLSVLRCAA